MVLIGLRNNFDRQCYLLETSFGHCDQFIFYCRKNCKLIPIYKSIGQEYCLSYYTPTIYRTHLVRLSVPLSKICVWSVSYIGSFYFTQTLLMIWGCFIFKPKIIWVGSKTRKGNVHDLCPVKVFLMEKYWNSLLHTMIVLHYFDPKYFVRSSWSLSKIRNSCLCHIIFWIMIRS